MGSAYCIGQRKFGMERYLIWDAVVGNRIDHPSSWAGCKEASDFKLEEILASSRGRDGKVWKLQAKCSMLNNLYKGIC